MSVARTDTGSKHTCERCGRPVPAKPQGGRPYRFCPDSADAPGTSCLELDKQERAALERAGLGELVSAFRADRDVLLTALQPLVAPFAALGARLEAIEAAAIARAEQAEQARLTAEAAQRAADRDKREAEQRTTRAYELRDEALADRDRAVDDEQQARREADDAITRALKAEHARGLAQATAEERARAQHAEEQRRLDAEHELGVLRDQLTAERRDVARLKTDLAEAGRAEARLRLEHHEQLSRAHADLDRAQTALRAAVADRDALQTRTEVLAGEVDDGQRRLETLRTELAEARADAERQQTELTRRAELAEQRATTAAQQQAAADTRYQDLLAALAAGRFTTTPGADQQP